MNKYFPTHNSVIPLVNNELEGVTYFDKWGRNPDIDTTSDPEDIWAAGGLYTGFPTETEPLEILSSSADDAAAGTGARTVKVTGLLDGDFNRMPDVEVTLNGTTPVSLGTQTYHRSNRIQVLTVGSGGSNAGVLTLRHSSTTANIFATVAIGANQTQIFQFTVPADETLYVVDHRVSMARASGAAGSANYQIQSQNDDNGVWRVLNDYEITDSKDFRSSPELPSKYPAKTDIRSRIVSVSDSNTVVSAEAKGFFITN